MLVAVVVAVVCSYIDMRQKGVEDVEEGVDDDSIKDEDGELVGFALGINDGSVDGCSELIEDGSEDADGDSELVDFALGIDEGAWNR
jgi:hypothetical protein